MMKDSPLLQFSWITYCTNPGCNKYLQNNLVGVVVPSMAQGMEDAIDLFCEECTNKMQKINDMALPLGSPS